MLHNFACNLCNIVVSDAPSQFGLVYAVIIYLPCLAFCRRGTIHGEQRMSPAPNVLLTCVLYAGSFVVYAAGSFLMYAGSFLLQVLRPSWPPQGIAPTALQPSAYKQF